jgi:hypothetical protein
MCIHRLAFVGMGKGQGSDVTGQDDMYSIPYEVGRRRDGHQDGVGNSPYNTDLHVQYLIGLYNITYTSQSYVRQGVILRIHINRQSLPSETL